MNSSEACRKCRQVGEKLFLKGTKCRTAKCPLEHRGTIPGEHSKKIGARKLSEYGRQLREKQKVKLLYGVLERQFRRFFEMATRRKGVTGENLLSLLEKRLDNVVYRLKMAFSRKQARQMIIHGFINVNGRRVVSPSFLVREGDVITLSDKILNNKLFMTAVVDKRLNMGVKVPEWLELQKKEYKGVILRDPIRTDITDPIEEHLIVELYSK